MIMRAMQIEVFNKNMEEWELLAESDDISEALDVFLGSLTKIIDRGYNEDRVRIRIDDVDVMDGGHGELPDWVAESIIENTTLRMHSRNDRSPRMVPDFDADTDGPRNPQGLIKYKHSAVRYHVGKPTCRFDSARAGTVSAEEGRDIDKELSVLSDVVNGYITVAVIHCVDDCLTLYNRDNAGVMSEYADYRSQHEQELSRYLDARQLSLPLG